MMLKIRKVAKQPRGDGKEAPRITEDDTYVAHLVKVQKFKSKKHPEWDESFRFIFRVLQEPFVGGFASGITPSMWYQDGKLDSWLKMLGVEQSEDGDELDVHAIKGQKVRILVKISNDGFANVTDLFAMRDQDHELIAAGALDNDYKKKREEANQSAQTQAAPIAPAPAPAPVAAPAPVVKTQSAPPAPAAPTPKAEPVDDTQGDDIPF